MKIANHLLLSSLALSATMIGCNKKTSESPREKAVEMQTHGEEVEIKEAKAS